MGPWGSSPGAAPSYLRLGPGSGSGVWAAVSLSCPGHARLSSPHTDLMNSPWGGGGVASFPFEMRPLSLLLESVSSFGAVPRCYF